MAAATYFNQVQQLYIAYFGRPADPVGLNYWAASIDAAGGNFDSVISGFSSSLESKALYAGSDTSQLVTSIYVALFNRPPEPAGLAYWVGLIDSNTVTGSRAAYQIMISAGPGDATAIANKVAAANAFTANIDTIAELAGYSGASSAAIARAWLAKVDATPYSITNLTSDTTKGVADATGIQPGAPTAPAGPSFTATKDGSNVVTFTNAGLGLSVTKSGAVYTFTSNGAAAGSATVTGPISSIVLSPSNASLTITSSLADGIIFSNGTIRLSDTTAQTATLLTSLEQTSSALIDATRIPGITAATDAQALALLVTNNGNSGNKIWTAADVAVTLTGSTADAATLKAIQGATTGLVDASSFTSLTSASVADAQLLLITNQGSTGDKIKIAPGIAVTLTDSTATGTALKAIDDATTGTIDASSISSITAATVAQAKQFLVTDVTTVTHAASVTVSLTDASANAADLNAIDAATTGLVSATSLTSINGAVADVKTSLEAITLGTALSAPNLNSVSLTNAITTSALDNVVFANNTTLTLANVTGNALTLADATVSAGKTLTVDGSAVSAGGITLDGTLETNGTLTLKGGSGADTLAGGKLGDTLTGGTGADTFVYTTPANSSVTNFDTITDFILGTDKIKTGVGGGATSLNQGGFYTSSGSGNLANDISTAVNNGNDLIRGPVANDVYLVTITGTGSGKYIFQDTNGNGLVDANELVIKLTGTSSLTLAPGDFIA